MGTVHSFILGVLGSATMIYGQNSVPPAEFRPSSGVELPPLDSVRKSEAIADVKPKANAKADFVRKLTVESFGYSLAPTGPGYESAIRLSAGPFTDHGLECPRCIIRPSMERRRYTLPPFGSIATLKLADGRVNLFTGVGGINAWKPDNAIIDVDGNGFRRNSSFNDAWLVQGSAGANVAVDKGRRLWLGAAGRYLQNYGAGRRHWNTLGGSATILLGR